MAITYTCPGCKKVLAAKRFKKLSMIKGVKLETRPNLAPRFRCPKCGSVVILVQGSL